VETAWQIRSIEVRDDLADLERVTAILDELWERHALEAVIRADLNVAVEEILSNIIRHGGAGGKPAQARIEVLPERIRIEIRDRGAAFNPLEYPAPDTALSLDQRRPGGLGIFLVRGIMDQTEYQRRDGMNCFTMVKNRPAESAQSPGKASAHD
jgi:anti-sigma regulatory factor (Ser/Thr protein kinase)